MAIEVDKHVVATSESTNHRPRPSVAASGPNQRQRASAQRPDRSRRARRRDLTGHRPPQDGLEAGPAETAARRQSGKPADTTMGPRVILLPGGVMPAGLAYGPLLDALGDDVEAITKDLEVYAGPEPPPGYTLDHEIDGVLRTARDAGFESFHLVGYSGGGASSVAFAARHPERLSSLA